MRNFLFLSLFLICVQSMAQLIEKNSINQNFGSLRIGSYSVSGSLGWVSGENGCSIQFGQAYSTSPDFGLAEDSCSNTTQLWVAPCVYKIFFKPTSEGPLTGEIVFPGYRSCWSGDNGPVTNSVVVTGAGEPRPDEPNCKPGRVRGSVISIEGQSVSESIPIAGTTYELWYSSNYEPTYDSQISNTVNNISFRRSRWNISVQHFYDIAKSKLYYGNGEVAKRPSIPYSGGLLVIDANGKDAYIFDQASGHHKRTISTLTGVTKLLFEYDSAGGLAGIVDLVGKKSVINWDDGLITSPTGQTTSFQKVGDRIESVTLPGNETYELHYLDNGVGPLSSYTHPSGRMTTFKYNSFGRLLEENSPGGAKFTLSSSNGTSATMTTAMGRTISSGIGIQSNGDITWSQKGLNGRSTAYREYRTSGAVTREIIAYLNEYNETADDERFGSLLKRTTLRNTAHQTLSKSENFEQVVLPGNSDYFAYTKLRTSHIIDSKALLVNEFDNLNKSRLLKSAAGSTIKMIYDNLERPISIQIGNDVPAKLVYDGFGRIAELARDEFRKNKFSYNQAGELIESENEIGRKTQFQYDSAGRLTKVSTAQTEVNYSFNKEGRMISVVPNSRPAHIFEYGLLGKLEKYIPPALTGVPDTSFGYSYNLDRQIVSMTKPGGAQASFSYGSTNNLLSQIQVPQGVYSYVYSTAVPGRISYGVSPDQVRTDYLFTGPLVREIKNTDLINNTIVSKVNYTFTFDNALLPSAELVQGWSGAATELKIRYNSELNIVTKDKLAVRYEYPAGRQSGSSLGFVSEQKTFDSYGNLKNSKTIFKNSNGPVKSLYEYSLERNLMGRIVKKTEKHGSTVAVYDYSYDSLSRLTEVRKNGSIESSIQYDANSNQISGMRGGVPFIATFDDQDRLLSQNSHSFSYSADGTLKTVASSSVVKNYVYGFFGNLQSFSGDTISKAQRIDHQNSVVKNSSSSDATWYARDLNRRILARISSGGAIEMVYIYGSSSNSPDALIRQGTYYKIVKDHLGSPRFIVDSGNGQIVQEIEYDSWGAVTVDTNPGFQDFGFAGGEYDPAIGLVRFGARDYDPATGRWTAKDPILFDGGDANLYGYVMNDPINLIDPSGESWRDVNLRNVFGGVALVGGGIALLGGATAIGSTAIGAPVAVVGSFVGAGAVGSGGLLLIEEWNNLYYGKDWFMGAMEDGMSAGALACQY